MFSVKVLLIIFTIQGVFAAKKEIHVASLLPFSGSFVNGLPCDGAYKMALEDVEKQGILPNHRLVLHTRDTECSAGMAVYQMHELLFTPPVKHVLLGPTCSDCCVATAEAAVHWNITQTTGGCGTPVLSDPVKFPLFMRVNTVDLQANVLRIHTLKKYNWTRFAIIQTPHDLFNLVVVDLIQRAKKEKMSVLTSETITGDYNFTLDRIKQSQARIIFLFSYTPDGLDLFCAAYKKGLYGSRYIFIVPGWWPETDLNEKHADCTPESLQQVIQYTLGIAASFTNSKMDEITKYGFTTTDLMERLDNLNITDGTNILDLNCYDAIWTIAYGLRNVMDLMKEENWTRTLDDFTYKDKAISELLWKEMTSLQYAGVRGPVAFAENGDALGLFRMGQLNVDGQDQLEWLQLAVYDPLAPAGQQLTQNPDHQIHWRGGKPPKDAIVSVKKILRVTMLEYVSVCVLSVLGLTATTFFMFFNFYHRQKRFIKMSSPNLNNVTLVGCAVMYLSVFFADLGPRQLADGSRDTNVQMVFCKIQTILASIGFSLAFGALFSKTYRVHRIFLNKKLQRRIVKDRQLLAMVGVLVLVDVIVFILWEIIDPRIATIVPIQEQVVDDDTVEIIEVTKCGSTLSSYFVAVLYGIKGILLIFGAFLSWETRKVNVPELNDSRNIGLCIYNVIVVSLLAVGMTFALDNAPGLTYLIASLCNIFATTFTTCMIFVPKVMGIIGGKVGAEQLSEGTIGTIHAPVQEATTSSAA